MFFLAPVFSRPKAVTVVQSGLDQPLYWYIPHFICLFASFLLLALNFVFSKTESFKLLFILFVIKQLLGNVTSDINIQPSQVLSDEGKLNGGNSGRNTAYLKLTHFYEYFCELKKLVFCEYLFLRMASFWKFWVYKFKPQSKKNKKETVESRDIRLFLSKSTERQAGHDEKLLLLIGSKKSWIRLDL